MYAYGFSILFFRTRIISKLSIKYQSYPRSRKFNAFGREICSGHNPKVVTLVLLTHVPKVRQPNKSERNQRIPNNYYWIAGNYKKKSHIVAANIPHMFRKFDLSFTYLYLINKVTRIKHCRN